MYRVFMYQVLLLNCMMLFFGFSQTFAAEASGEASNAGTDEVGASGFGAEEEIEVRLAVSNHSKALTRGRELTESFFDSEFVAGFVLGSGFLTRNRLKSIAEKTGKPGAFETAERLAWAQSAFETGETGEADLTKANQKFSAFFSTREEQE